MFTKPFIGGMIADTFLGYYLTIVIRSAHSLVFYFKH